MNYLEWNNKISEYLFNKNMAGREVLLYCNKESLDEIGTEENNLHSFITAIKIGPPWVTRQGICQKALQAQYKWRARSLQYPPYIAYLVLFVLAETIDINDTVSPRSYYQKLHQILDEQGEKNTFPSFDKMWELWFDLEIWSKEDMHEELGIFTPRRRYKWEHVGMPLAQTLLSFNERASLPTLFTYAHLDPTNIPSTNVLNNLLIRYGKKEHLLFKRTWTLLQSNNDDDIELKNGLLELLTDELSSWDGVNKEINEKTGEEKTSVSLGIRLCLEIDNLSQEIQTFLCLKSNRPLPESKLVLNSPEAQATLVCDEYDMNWSTRFLKKEGVFSGKPFDASSINWSNDINFMDDSNSWSAHFKGNDVRVFVPGNNVGSPYTWIEVSRLERNWNFLIACTVEKSSLIRSWGESACESLQIMQYRGLPHGWVLFRGQNAKLSCPGIDMLNLSNLRKVELVDGIRAHNDSGNRFIIFALPKIKIHNAIGNETIKINEISGVKIEPYLWGIPPALRRQQQLKIVVIDEKEKEVNKIILYAEEPSLPEDNIHFHGLNGIGSFLNNPLATNYVKGGIVHSTSQSSRFPYLLPLHLARKIIFVGSTQEKIFEWTQGNDIPRWEPVWAIALDKYDNGTIHFCGTFGKNDEPIPKIQSFSDIRTAIRWKNAILPTSTYRKPRIKKILLLWEKYEKIARND